MRVLVLDDDEVRHEAFAEHFKGQDILHTWTFEECCLALRDHGPWDIVYLDHDLNDHEVRSVEHGAYGKVELTGFDVCRFITRTLDSTKWPPEIVVHSWNPPGARLMIECLRASGIRCNYRPFQGTAKKLVDDDPEQEAGWVTVCESCLEEEAMHQDPEEPKEESQ